MTIEMALYVSEVDAKRTTAEKNLQKAHDELTQNALELARVNTDLQAHQVELEE